jgi:hypothetical protein
MITPRKPDSDKTIWDASETCWVLGVTYKTLVNLIVSKGLPAKNIGSAKRAQYLFLKADIEDWMKEDRYTVRKILAGVLQK